MEIDIQELDECRRMLTVTVPAEQVEADIHRALQKTRSQARLSGFRPGKAPAELIRQRYGAEVRNQTIQRLVDSSWREALAERQRQPLAEPSIDQVEYQESSGLRYRALFEERPKLDFVVYRGAEARRPRAEVTEEQFQAELQRLRRQQGTLEPVSGRSAEAGDTAVIDCSWEIEGGGATPRREENAYVLIDPESDKTGFADQLLGMEPETHKEFSVEHPADAADPQMRGQTVHYRVDLKALKRERLPELGDDLARDLGFDSLADLHAKVRAELEAQAQRRAAAQLEKNLLDAIFRDYPFRAPEALIRHQTENFLQSYARDLMERGMKSEQLQQLNWNELRERYRPEAEWRVKRLLLLDWVADQEQIEAPDEQVERELSHLRPSGGRGAAAATAAEPAAAEGLQTPQEKSLKEFIRQEIRRRMTVDLIQNAARIDSET